jgi:hypothetical protein
VRGGGEDGHVRADLSNDLLGRTHADPDDLIQLDERMASRSTSAITVAAAGRDLVGAL